MTRPLIRKRGKLRESSWDEAMDLFVSKTKRLVKKHTAGAIGVYTSGQLFIEEYYTLAMICRAGLGTPHLDGNTRLCTATAAQALMESFGTDGQPGSYSDFDTTAAILLAGHNPASQQTVLWARILDRRRSANPPKLVVIDPRVTESAAEADVHLAPRVATNLPLMYGILHRIIRAGHVDAAFVDAHTVGFRTLCETVDPWTPERVERETGVPRERLLAAAEILGTAPSLVSTVLQGFYQSHQATASAVQINNLHLVRGMIGKPGCGLLQMNGQPTAQNTREAGCNGALPGFRNWHNPEHIADLARHWNVDPQVIPHWAPPTHAMEIFRYAEQGTIKLLWVSATNPLVSLPDLPRMRKIFAKEDLFVVVQDAFMTETAELADLVLPAAIWGEKTGTFTNTDRTVHVSKKAIEPPGEARADLDIFLDFARRMDFRDKDGARLVPFTDARGAFEAFKGCTRGRPCDYSAMSYEKLAERSGIQWPCTEAAPNGTERLYTDGVFNTDAEGCEDFGHDLYTGAATEPEQYRAQNPRGRAWLKVAEYHPPPEHPDRTYPFWLTTGRIVHHFHTRTKTGRAPALQAAAPEPFVQLAAEDAKRLGIAENDMVRVESRRGWMEARARIGGIIAGHAFVPFHYGTFDQPDRASRPRAANELTLPEWDPVSKQPYFKYAAVKISKGRNPSARDRKARPETRTR